jgi:2-dehydro-3-deoxygluconokinase
MADLELAGFGEAMVLFESTALDRTDSVSVSVAGAELNLCAAAAHCGISTAFATRVGDDPLGTRVLNEIANLGVSSSLVVRSPSAQTGLFLKEIQPDGQRRVFYYRAGSAASTMDTSDADRLLRQRPQIVAVSGITAALGPEPRAAVEHLARHATLAFDPNFRPALGLEAQIAFARGILPHVDHLILGTDEASLLFGSASPFDAFAGDVILKAGKDGCYYRDSDGGINHQPSLVDSVVDPVGAGDAFAGGYLAARLRHAAPSRAAHIASELAAAVVGSRGDTAGLVGIDRQQYDEFRVAG